VNYSNWILGLLKRVREIKVTESPSPSSWSTLCYIHWDALLQPHAILSPANQVGNWELFGQLMLPASRLTLFTPADLDSLLPWYAQLLLEELLQSYV